MRHLPILLISAAGLAAQTAKVPDGVPLRTRFAAEVPAATPRPEYPRPQMVRDDGWLCLNGTWEFSSRPEGDYEARILVPFAPETGLSGLYKNQEVMERVRYRRGFTVPEAWRAAGRAVILNFEAVDWEAAVTIDGKEAGKHRGGYGRFGFDVTKLLGDGPDHVVEVAVFDPADPKKDGFQPRGKQLGSEGIWYTRTTGIWQSVWLESAPAARIESLTLRAGDDGRLEVKASGGARGQRVEAKVSGAGRSGRPVLHTLEGAPGETLAATVADVRLWSPDSPALYDIEVRLLDRDGKVADRVMAYTGFRTASASGAAWRLNGAPLFLRGVLDQGYWPEGGLTAPTDSALRADVELMKSLGLNLARKHVKLEDARWYWWCDKLGLLVMQDMPSSMNLASDAARTNFLAEMEAMVEKAGNHPSVVHWVAFNEDWGAPGAFQTKAVDHLRKLDPSRPVTDASGWTQGENTDVTDVHDYGADLAGQGIADPKRPKIIGECGGVAFWADGHTWSKGWGYTTASTPAAWIDRVRRLASQPFEAKNISGYVWTQLSDVEQELNGLVHYDRTPKVPVEKLARALQGLDRPPPPLTADGWLLLGPVPAGPATVDARNTAENRAALERMLDGVCLPGEAELAPKDGGTATLGEASFTWIRHAGRPETVDLRAAFGGKADRCVAYAAGTLTLAAAGRVSLLFGSDDAAKVWIDGKEVHRVVAIRGVNPGQDLIPDLELAAGAHRVVVKVAQGVGGFGFSLWLER